jgi:thymidylate kinase
LSYFFYGFTWLLGYWGKKGSNGEYSIDPLGKAPKNVREKGLDSLRLLFLFADFQIITLKARLLLLLGKTVVVDRYVYDLIAGLMVLGQLTNSFAKLLLQTVPTPNLTIFLDAPEDVISARRNIPIDVARKNREAYLLLASALNFSVLDTSNDFSENQKEIRRKFFLYLKNAKEKSEGMDI